MWLRQQRAVRGFNPFTAPVAGPPPLPPATGLTSFSSVGIVAQRSMAWVSGYHGSQFELIATSNQSDRSNGFITLPTAEKPGRLLCKTAADLAKAHPNISSLPMRMTGGGCCPAPISREYFYGGVSSPRLAWLIGDSPAVGQQGPVSHLFMTSNGGMTWNNVCKCPEWESLEKKPSAGSRPAG